MEKLILGTSAAEIITPGFTSGTVSGWPTPFADRILARGGDDKVRAGGGPDTVKLGKGDDIFIWHDGDGGDFVDGGRGDDIYRLKGTQENEHYVVTAQDGLAFAVLGIGHEPRGIDNVETIQIKTRGGEDQVWIDDMDGTDVKVVEVDLSKNGKKADKAVDVVIIDGADEKDDIVVKATEDGVKVKGLSAKVIVDHVGDNGDHVQVKGFGGADRIDAAKLPKGAVKLHLDGGDGNDVLLGSKAGDVLVGGDGDDRVVGKDGRDVLAGGLGKDKLIGGNGKDRFAFTENYDEDQVDRIKDFDVDKDKVVLRDIYFSELGETVEASEFTIGSAATESDHHLIYNAANGRLLYDWDGFGGDPAVEFASLAKNLALTHQHFGVFDIAL
ncbi:hypothetical protein [Bauldia sp.]|uniref:hypothetical protein n=1 Tax=Bauldia sp. TaxID=2575872 RepID=UPI003BA8CDB9